MSKARNSYQLANKLMAKFTAVAQQVFEQSGGEFALAIEYHARFDTPIWVQILLRGEQPDKYEHIGRIRMFDPREPDAMQTAETLAAHARAIATGKLSVQDSEFADYSLGWLKAS
ncbi:hypothetical protein ACPV5S_15835 [Vibrio astriarenae]